MTRTDLYLALLRPQLVLIHLYFYIYALQIGDDVEQDLGGGAIELGLERVLGEYSISLLCLQLLRLSDHPTNGYEVPRPSCSADKLRGPEP